MLKEVENLLLSSSQQKDQVPFPVFATELIDFDPSLGYTLLHFPRLLLPLFKDSLLDLQNCLHQHPAFERKHASKGRVKELCNIRVLNVPPLAELNKRTISDIRATDYNQFIQISGTVVRTGSVRVLEVSKQYQCCKPRYGHKFRVLADPEQNNMLPTPKYCPAVLPHHNTAGSMHY